MRARRTALFFLRGPRSFLPAIAAAILLAAAVTVTGCAPDFDPASLLLDVRVLAVRCDAAELAPGQTGTLRALHVPVAGVTLDWSYCTEAPAPTSTGPVNLDCVQTDSASYIVPLGSGETVQITMPALMLSATALPDATGGIYLPVRVRVTGPTGDAAHPTKTDTGIFRLRYHFPQSPLPPNNNPTLAGLEFARGTAGAVYDEDAGAFAGEDAGVTPGAMLLGEGYDLSQGPGDDMATDGGGSDGGVDERLAVKKGEKISMVPVFAPGSAEDYQTISLDRTITKATEILQMDWYSTAGTFSLETSGPDQRQTFTLTDNAHLPAPGSAIDLYVVARDGRGGIDWLHRQLVYQP